MPEAKKIKRIALVLNELQGGGAESVMITLANYWAEQDIRIDFLLGNRQGPNKDRLSNKINIIVFEKPIKGLLFPLIRYLNREQPDLLLSTLHSVNVVAVLAGKH